MHRPRVVCYQLSEVELCQHRRCELAIRLCLGGGSCVFSRVLSLMFTGVLADDIAIVAEEENVCQEMTTKLEKQSA